MLIVLVKQAKVKWADYALGLAGEVTFARS